MTTTLLRLLPNVGDAANVADVAEGAVSMAIAQIEVEDDQIVEAEFSAYAMLSATVFAADLVVDMTVAIDVLPLVASQDPVALALAHMDDDEVVELNFPA